MPSPLELWLTALKSEVGICIETNDRLLLRQQLYQTRKHAKNPMLDTLKVIMPKDSTKIMIVHRDAEEK